MIRVLFAARDLEQIIRCLHAAALFHAHARVDAWIADEYAAWSRHDRELADCQVAVRYLERQLGVA